MGYIASALGMEVGDNKKEENPDSQKPDLRSPCETSGLESHSWRNWILLSGISIITTIGLSLALSTYFIDQSDGFWLWRKTDWLLVIGLVSIVIMFISYLTQKQAQIARTRSQLQSLQSAGEKRSRKNATRLCALLNVSHYMGTELNPQYVFDCIAKTCMEVFESTWVSLMLYHKDTQDLEVRSVCGDADLDTVVGARQKLGDGIAGMAAKKRTPILLGQASDLDKYFGTRDKYRHTTAAMIAPIILRNELIGIINVSSCQPGSTYEEDDLRALQVFAENAGACILNAERIELLTRRENNEEEASLQV